MDTAILTSSSPLFRANGATNSTTAGTAPANPTWTTTKPSGAGVHGMGEMTDAPGAYSRNSLLILPYGVGSSTNTFFMSVFAWDVKKATSASFKDIWVAWPLLAVTCTLAASPGGVANTDVDASQLAVGTITMTTNFGTANVSNEIISPAGNYQASIVLDVKGCRLVQFLFGVNNSTSANALCRRM